MKPVLFITNGFLVTHSGVVRADLEIHEGKVSGIFSPGEKHHAEEIIDAKGMLVLPGVIDSHVHFNEPGRESWEGFETGSKSAAAGGITTVIDMPLNSSPCTLNLTELKRKVAIGKKLSVVDFGLWGGATPNNMDELESLHRGGVLGFKAFMSNSGIDEFNHINDGDLLDIFQRLGKLSQVLGLHAENDSITAYLAEKLKSSGRVDRRAYLESRPPFVEEEAVNRALLLAGNSPPGVTLHFVHTTVAGSMQAIAEAKRKGLRVSVETCPHYLTLTDKDFVKLGPVAKCAPLLRSEKEVEALWKCVRTGLVDTIGSDHSPCTFGQKTKGDKNIWKAWGGISGIQTMLPVMYSEGVVKRRLAPSRLVNLLSYNPARLFGLYPRKGVLQAGSDADVVLFDPKKKWVIRKENLLYKNKHSPFVGKKVTGSVEMTILRGKIVYRGGEIMVPPGTGRFLSRQSFSQTRTTR